MRYKNIFFDLDGTVTEPVLGITNAIIHALKKFGIEINDRKQLYKYIGPPLRESFMEFNGFSKEQAEEAVLAYREYYSDKGILENDIMPGMEEALEKLAAAGCHLFIATSKPEIFAIQILKHLKLDGYFDIIAGSLLDGSRDKKEDVIKNLLDRSGIGASREEMENTVMVGDRKFDIIGARHFNLDNIGVLFGYGDKTELDEAGAMLIVNTAEELVSAIERN